MFNDDDNRGRPSKMPVLNTASASAVESRIDAVIEKVLKLGTTQERNDPLRVRHLRVSSFPFCARQWFLNLARGGARTREQTTSTSYFTRVGTEVHEVFQESVSTMPRLPQGAFIIQDWVCLNCKIRHEFQPRPVACSGCGGTRLKHDEHTVRYGRHTLGHIDGTFGFPHELGAPYSKKWIHVPIDYKGLALDTPLPTPTGWTTMGEVQEGDYLLGSDGKPCKVLSKSAVHKRKCYKMTFDDGSSVVCDDEHLWTTTYGRKGRVRKTEVVNTEFIKSSIIENHQIPLCGRLFFPKADLPIDPYVLGCWLGDGTAANATITKNDAELFDHIEKLGYKTHQPPHNVRDVEAGKAMTRRVEGLHTRLRECGLLNNKHIPDVYLRASIGQRLALLQGLLDTDGSYNSLRKQVVFSTVDENLAYQVQDLICGLGQRGVVIPITAHGFGLTVQAYHVRFRPVKGIPPFRLTRKADLIQDCGLDVRSTRRKIVSVEPVKAVKTQCVSVDSPDKTYLCTRSMIPTHNTCSRSVLDSGKLPYAYNLDQLYSYGAIKAVDGYNVPGVCLIYIVRDNPHKRGTFYRPLDLDRQLARIDKYEDLYEQAKSTVTMEEALALPARATKDFDRCEYCPFQQACDQNANGNDSILRAHASTTVRWLQVQATKTVYPTP